MNCNSSLPGSNKTICNVFVDDNNNVLHVYDDLKHCSTSIFKELDKNLIVELTSLLGVEYGKYRIILYYSPIIKKPLIREYDLSIGQLVSVNKKDLNETFYKMAFNNEELKR
ncbi:hypothetical protein GZ159_09525 [Staphylococcus aureus]|uniref:hypothetical protein n=1 Tax=Staphylococcus aureus TaxID=1280 RepID=UPI0013A68D8C|nr:hypothetical protein [Staphylococcus aureus]NDQ74010.1 hypothetical protein [Staphylococcus aureus]HDZ8817144.1 hypothetical protein [Staphylococcus aureus]